MSGTFPVDQSLVNAYESDGVVLVKGLFRDWVETICAGIERNMTAPGEYASENLKDGESGRFFDDYCNWTRIPEFEQVVRHSPAGEVAATLMQSETVQMYHDHILVKEPGTTKETPWHQDAPYWFVEGKQTISLWSPMDPVSSATLRCVIGSHKWEKLVLPVRWLSGNDFYAGDDSFMPIPDPDAEPEKYQIAEWAMEPGDAIAFHHRTLHGARGNTSANRRRAFSLRFVGDDARYVERAGPTSPPYPGHNMQPGQKLREDWFPTIYDRRRKAA